MNVQQPIQYHLQQRTLFLNEHSWFYPLTNLTPHLSHRHLLRFPLVSLWFPMYRECRVLSLMAKALGQHVHACSAFRCDSHTKCSCQGWVLHKLRVVERWEEESFQLEHDGETLWRLECIWWFLWVRFHKSMSLLILVMNPVFIQLIHLKRTLQTQQNE